VRFAFSEDQEAFRQALRELLEKQCPPSELRAALEGRDTRATERWSRLAELGVTGLMVPEGHGGLGMDELDLAVVLEECGRAGLPDPLAETAAVGAPLLVDLGAIELAGRVLPEVAAGTALLATGVSPSPYVVGADRADLLLLTRGAEVHAVPSDEADVHVEPSLDAARPVATVTWEPDSSTLVGSGDQARRALASAVDRGVLASAAELIGVAERLVDLACEHARQRVQFGQPIGSFQAVKHMLAEALLRLDFARPLVYRAAYSMAQGDGERSLHCSMSKIYAGDAAGVAARVALQVHGAIGYTWEHDVQLWLKRAWSLSTLWGGSDWHKERVAGCVVGPLPSR
jgi:alkylation response protein AidB-like acyl-CoA dehydrogenase